MNTKLKKLLSLCIVLLMLLAAAPAAGAYSSDGGENAGNAAEWATGLLPSEDLKLHFAWEEGAGAARRGVLPSSYGFTLEGDGQEQRLNVLNQSSVKDQKQVGMCWAYAGNGALEAYLLKNGLDGEPVSPDIDFSEQHAAYSVSWYGLSETDVANPFEGCIESGFGGAYSRAWLSYAMRSTSLAGPVLERDDPNGDLSNKNQPYRDIAVTRQISENRFCRVTEASFLTRSVEAWGEDIYEHYINPIKQGVMRAGSVVAPMYINTGRENYNSETGAYYFPQDASANHAILIVGWDDDYPKEYFSTEPPGNGAWLVKNSWSTGWGIPNGDGTRTGYFWASYYDINFLEDTFCIEGVETVDPGLVIYDDARYIYGAAGNGYTTISCLESVPSEIYAIYPKEGEGAQLLEGISIALDSNATFDLYVNADYSPKKPSEIDPGDFTFVQRMTTDAPGFYTLPLEPPIPFEGDFLAVYIKLIPTEAAPEPHVFMNYLQYPGFEPGEGRTPPTFQYEGETYEYTYMREQNGDGTYGEWRSTFINPDPPETLEQDEDTFLPCVRLNAGKLDITADGVAAVPGDTLSLSAARGGLFRDAAAAWQVNGNASADTAIDGSGVLTVGADETAKALNVTLSSEIGGSVYSDSAVIPVLHDALIISDETGRPVSAAEFERAKAGQAKSLTFTVTNYGDAAALSVTAELGDGGGFVLAESDLGDILPGESASFTVSVDGNAAPGLITDTVAVRSSGEESASLSLTAPVCVELTLEGDVRITGMTGREGLYLPGETAGVSAAARKCVFYTWEANGERQPSEISANKRIGSLLYTMPAEDVTLKAKTAFPDMSVHEISAAPGDSFDVTISWMDWDGNFATDYGGAYETGFCDKNGDPVDWASYDAERGVITLSSDIPSEVEGFYFVVSATEVDDDLGDECAITVLRPAPVNDDDYDESDDADVPVTQAAPVKEEINVAETYSDISEDAWYYEAVDWAVNEGLMDGVGDDVFAPDGTGTRAMAVTILWRLAGEPEAEKAGFSDLDENAWYETAVNWAAATGAVQGTSEDEFSPNEPITREQLAVILYRYAQSRGMGFAGDWAFRLDYSDAGDISDYAYEAMCWMTMHGVIEGMSDGRVAPRALATRAQIAAIFMRFSETIGE